MTKKIKNNKKAEKTKGLKFFGLGKLKPYIKTYKGIFATIIIATLAVGVINVITPLFQRYAIDNFIANRTLDGLAVFIMLYVLVVAASVVIDFFGSYGCCRLEMFMLRDMRRTAFNHLQTLSVSYYNMHSVGKLHARVMSDTSVIGSTVAWDTYQGVWNIVYALGTAVVMFILDPILALCVLVIVPIVALVSVYFQRKLTKLHRETREINSEITGGFNEGITGAATSKTLAVEDKLDADFRKKTDAMKKKGSKLGHHRALFFSLIAFAASIALALVLYYGGIITQKGVIEIGTLSVFMTYAQGIVEPVQWSVDAIADLISVKVNIERFTALTESASDVKDTPEAVEKYGDCFNEKRENWEKLVGDVEFDDVSFKYPDGDEYVLEHFDLKVPQGTNVAIVGETGAGKSTLVNLVCRFFEPTSGRLLIDGKDARERSVQWLHSNIGYVLQTPHCARKPFVRQRERDGRTALRRARQRERAFRGGAHGQGLGLRGRRGRQHSVDGRKAVAVVCARHTRKPRDIRARRGDKLDRHVDRKTHSERDRKTNGRQNEFCHCAQTVDDPFGGRYTRRRRRKDSRARLARGAVKVARRVL